MKRCHELLNANSAKLAASVGEGRSPHRIRHAEPIPPVTIDGAQVSSAIYEITYIYANEAIPTRISAKFDVPGRGNYIEFEFVHPHHGPLRVSIGASEIGMKKDT